MGSITVTLIDVNGASTTIADARTGISLMEVARSNGVRGILADCGGACACATCHVYVDPEWMTLVGPPDAIEDEMLDMVSNIRQKSSRLSCQIELRPALDGLKVTVAPLG